MEVAEQDVSQFQSKPWILAYPRCFGIVLILGRGQVEQNDHAVWLTMQYGPQLFWSHRLMTDETQRPSRIVSLNEKNPSFKEGGDG